MASVRRPGSVLAWRPAREARTVDYRDGAGLFAAMLGDSTVRDFAIESAGRMLWRQWLGYQSDPFLNREPERRIDSVFERLARRGPVRAVEYARSGAGVGPARTWARRRFQWIANVRTFAEQIDEPLAEPSFPDLTLVWIGHNNLDFATEGRRFSPRGDPDEACDGIVRAFARAFRADLARLVRRASRGDRPRAIVVYGLVNPTATRVGRDRARELRARSPRLYPCLEKAEQRFPPLRPEHGDRLVALSRGITRAIEAAVADARGDVSLWSGLEIAYSDATTRMDFARPELLSPTDAWHASDAGKALIASALFEGVDSALASFDRRPAPARHEKATGTSG